MSGGVVVMVNMAKLLGNSEIPIVGEKQLKFADPAGTALVTLYSLCHLLER